MSKTMNNTKSNIVSFADYIHDPISFPTFPSAIAEPENITEETKDQGNTKERLSYGYSRCQIDLSYAEKQMEEALSMRDDLLKSTLLRGLRLKKGKTVQLDQYNKYNEPRQIRADIGEHIGRNVLARGINKWILKRRLSHDGSADFHIGSTPYTATHAADALWLSACKASKYVQMAQITKQLKEYRETYGKENCDYKISFDQAVHHGNSVMETVTYDRANILLRHIVSEDDAVIPEYSEPDVIQLPEEVSRKATDETTIDLSIYDDSFAAFVKENEELLKELDKQIAKQKTMSHTSRFIWKLTAITAISAITLLLGFGQIIPIPLLLLFLLIAGTPF